MTAGRAPDSTDLIWPNYRGTGFTHRGVHKLGRVPDPADFQGDRISAPHALAVTSEGDNPRKLDGLATER
jgi:hypothetical protein